MAVTFDKHMYKNLYPEQNFYDLRNKMSSSFSKMSFSNLLEKKSYHNDIPTTSVLKKEEYTNNLINLYKEFIKDREKITSVNYNTAFKKFSNILKPILKLKPDKVVLEITYDESIFFTLIKDSYKIYIEYYLDDDTTMSSVYENNIEINSFTGSNEYTFEKTNSILNVEDIVVQ